MLESKQEEKKKVYSSITNFWEKNKRMPSMSELAKLSGYKSKESAFRLSTRLIEEGFLAKDSTGRIYLKSVGKIKVLGHVEAGFPLPADEQLLKNISLDEWLIRNRSDSFMLSVNGDSMQDAGILDGDMIIVEKCSNAKIGEIVVARIDEGYTLKYLRKNSDGYYLEPANSNYSNIYPEVSLEIQAKLKAVIRKYE